MMAPLFEARRALPGQTLRSLDWVATWLVCCLVLSLFCGGTVRAAPAHIAPVLHFDHLGRAQGLPGGSVAGLAQDAAGFIWVGTNDGLYRYDGYRLHAYRGSPGSKNGLSSSLINILHIDGRGRLWIGTFDGLHQYLPAEDRFVRHVPPTPLDQSDSRWIRDITSDDTGAIWVAATGSLQRFDPDTGQFTVWRHDPEQPDGLAPGAVRYVTVGKQGELWVATGTFVNRLARSAKVFERYMPGEFINPQHKANEVWSVRSMRDGSLWVGSHLGVERWKPAAAGLQRELYDERHGVPPGGILDIAEDPEGNVWIGSINGGVKRWDVHSKTFQTFTHSDTNKHSVASPTVRRLMFDRSGLLWVGTENGLSRTDPHNGGFQRFRDEPALGLNPGARMVNAIAATADGDLWLGSGLGTIVHWRNSKGQQAEAVFEIVERYTFDVSAVHTLLLDKENGVWAGTGLGLHYLAPGASTFSKVPLGNSTGTLTSIENLNFDHDGQLWVATVGGLHRLDLKGNVKTFSPDPRRPGAISGRSNSILVDRKGRVWIGTNFGLDRWDAGKDDFTHIRNDPADPGSLPGNMVRHVIEDRSGNIWVATEKGVSWMAPDAPGKLRWRHFGHAEGLGANFTYGLCEDASGNIWVSTAYGLTRIDPVQGTVNNYYASDGLDEDGYLARAVYRTPDGRLVFGGVNGLTLFDPQALRANPHAPAIAVADILAWNRSALSETLPDVTLEGPRERPTGIAIGHKVQMLAFELTALNYSAPERNRYAYKLDGFDADWIVVGAERRLVSYNNLDPGRYVLRVKAANKDGVWNERPLSLNVTVIPPFWRTWWFRGLVVAGMVCGILLWHSSRIRRLQRHKRQLEGEVALRTADALHERDQAESARRRIAELSEAGRAITATLELTRISRSTCLYTGRFVNVAQAALGITRDDGRFHYQLIDAANQLREQAAVAAPEAGSIVARCLEQRREVFIELPGRELAAGAVLHGREADAAWSLGRTGSLVCLPVAIGEQRFGVLWACSPNGRDFSRVDIDSLLLLADYAAVALQNFDAYRQLRDSQQQLVLREKMAALGTLTAGVAHEINNPANFAHAGAQVLEQDLQALHRMLSSLAGDDDPDITRLLDERFGKLVQGTSTILTGTRRIRSLVRDLRTFVRLDEAERKEVRISEGLHATLALMRAQYPEVRIVPDLAADPLLECWPALLNQVFFGVLDNACRAIAAKAALAPSGWRGEVAVRSTVADAMLQVAFIDNGCGMPDAVRARVVEPFFTTRAVDEGTGLGLSIAFGIVARHQGLIRIDSIEGEGTTVIIVLPLAGDTGPRAVVESTGVEAS